MNMQRNVKLFFAYSILSRLIFHRGIFILYLLYLSFDGTQVAIFQIIIYVSMTLLEVPTGYIADRFGRKMSVGFGLFILAIHGLGMIIFPAIFTIFLLLMLLHSLGTTLISGAGSALLYDTLKEGSHEDDYLAINSKIQSVSAVSLGIAMIVGGLLQDISWNYVFIAYMVANVLACIIVAMMHEPLATHEHTDNGLVSRDAVTGFLASSTGKRTLMFFAVCALFEALATPYFIFGQSLLAHHQFSVFFVATFFAIAQFVSAVSFALTGAVVRRMGELRSAFLIIGMTTALALATLVLGPTLAAVSLFLICILPDPFYVISDAHMQRTYPSPIRATLGSLFNASLSVGIAAGYGVIGYIGGRYDIVTAMTSLFVFGVLSLLLLVKYMRKPAVDWE